MTTFAPSNSQSASVSSAAGTLSVRVAIDIQYALNGDPAPHVMEHLHAAISRAIGGGLLSGSLGVEVDEYSVGIEVVPDSLDEDDVADYLDRRIADGNLALEDIPSRLARYGLMERPAFIGEMRERMGAEEGDVVVRDGAAAPQARVGA